MEFVIIIAAFGIMLASLAGVLFTVARAGNWVEENLIYLNTFAAGVFSIVSVSILREAFEFSISTFVTATAVLFGFCIFFLAEYLLPESHCHHDDELCIHNEQDKRKAWKVLLSDAVHNIGDGVLLVPVFLINTQLGLIAAVGIFIHELVQGVAEFFVLRRAGYSTLQALQRNFAVSATILIGVFAGSAFMVSEVLVAPLIGFAAGGFIHIVLVDLLPLSVKEAREKKKFFEFLFAFALGITLIFMVNVVTAKFFQTYGLGDHGHVDGEIEGHQDEEEGLHLDDDHIDEEVHVEREPYEENLN